MARRHRIVGRVVRRSLRAARTSFNLSIGVGVMLAWSPVFGLLYLHMLRHSARESEGVPDDDQRGP